MSCVSAGSFSTADAMACAPSLPIELSLFYEVKKRSIMGSSMNVVKPVVWLANEIEKKLWQQQEDDDAKEAEETDNTTGQNI